MNLSPPVISIYLMADADTADLAEAAAAAGAGLFEIGIPYSDPLADGPTVQRAGQRSLRGGMSTTRALDVVREIRSRVDVPVVASGDVTSRARAQAVLATTGAAAVMVGRGAQGNPWALRQSAIAKARTVCPEITTLSARWIHVVACTRELTAIELEQLGEMLSYGPAPEIIATGSPFKVETVETGARDRLSDRVTGLAQRVRAHTDLPLRVGFGISAPEHATAALAAGADGVVIGSKAIEVSESGGPAALAEFVGSMTAAVAARSAQ